MGRRAYVAVAVVAALTTTGALTPEWAPLATLAAHAVLLALVMSVVLAADSAMRATPATVRSSGIAHIVRASTLRLCPPAPAGPPPEGSVLDCTAPLHGRADVTLDGVRVVVTDSAVVATLRRLGGDETLLV